MLFKSYLKFFINCYEEFRTLNSHITSFNLLVKFRYYIWINNRGNVIEPYLKYPIRFHLKSKSHPFLKSLYNSSHPFLVDLHKCLLFMQYHSLQISVYYHLDFAMFLLEFQFGLVVISNKLKIFIMPSVAVREKRPIIYFQTVWIKCGMLYK